MNSYSIETLAVHAGYETDEATMSVTPPLYETNAYVFKDAEHARTLFELKEPGNIYSRLQNPTCDILERKVTAMDGGVAALSFASGHAAIFNTIINLCSEGDELVSSINIYGGAITLELETYLTDRIVLLANIRERALWGSSLDLFTTQFGLGIKFIIH